MKILPNIMVGILLRYSSFVFHIQHIIHSKGPWWWVRHILTGIRERSVCLSPKLRIQVFQQRDRWKMAISMWGKSINTVAVRICVFASRRLHQMTRMNKKSVSMLCCAVPCRAVPCRSVLCRAVLCRAVLCRAVPCCAVPCRACLRACLPADPAGWSCRVF
jgi:hypothetical protein